MVPTVGHTSPVPAYIVVNARVTDPDLLARYGKAALPTLANHDCKALIASNDAETIEGEPAGSRVVVLQFPSREAALAWYNSEDYQAVIGMRHDSTEGFAVIVDGLG
jgi:uncharacterized protein (DUF1330 family)